MNRITKLCSYLFECGTFADVACDHGYIAEYMLKNGLCESAVVSDISEKCLNKAETLLAKYISAGKCRAVCCDGLKGIDCNTDCVVIAGIGGEEIIKILNEGFMPNSFVFQPMKNANTLREYLLKKDCRIETDDIFTDGKKYYFIIKGSKGKAQKYTDAQLLYGKDSLNNPVFYDYLKEELSKKKSYLQSEMTEDSRISLIQQIKMMEEVLKGETERNTQ